MRRVQADGDQQRPDLLLKMLLDPTALICVALTVRNYFNADLCERGHQRVVVQRVLALNQRMGFRCKGLE